MGIFQNFPSPFSISIYWKSSDFWKTWGWQDTAAVFGRPLFCGPKAQNLAILCGNSCVINKQRRLEWKSRFSKTNIVPPTIEQLNGTEFLALECHVLNHPPAPIAPSAWVLHLPALPQLRWGSWWRPSPEIRAASQSPLNLLSSMTRLGRICWNVFSIFNFTSYFIGFAISNRIELNGIGAKLRSHRLKWKYFEISYRN